MPTDFIDCILLNVGKECYLLPMAAIAEVGTLDNAKCQYRQKGELREFLWRDLTIPLVTPDLKDLSNITLPKYAIINATYADNKKPPFFALAIERHPTKLRVQFDELKWHDKKNLKATYTKLADDSKGISTQEVILLDLFQMSASIEHRINLTQIPK